MTALQSIRQYFGGLYQGAFSVLRSIKTALPYLFNVRTGDLKKEVTEQYPDPVSSKTIDDLPARTRGVLFNDIEKCTGCGDCKEVCPLKCIEIEAEPGAHPAKVWVSRFDIDFSKCIFCGWCTEVCEPTSLKHSKVYEGATFTVADMKVSFGRGKISDAQREKWAIARQAVVDQKGGPIR